jgi:hypothetical protein
VTALFRTPARRIAFAVALSALIHAAILWLPHISLPHEDLRLPPLSARLEHLPSPAEHPARQEAPEPVTETNGSASAEPAAETTHTEKPAEMPGAYPLFPKHLQITFAVHKSADGFKVGNVYQQLTVNGNKYTLKAVKRITGLASLINDEEVIQTSRGKLGTAGLQPETFTQEKSGGSGKQKLQAVFDRQARELRFSSGEKTGLPADAQDGLSFMYQLSQLPMEHREFILLPVGDGAKLEQLDLEIGGQEAIDTPMGKLNALHLRKMHGEGAAYFEIWLGTEYRLLPVKFRQVDSGGNVTEEMVVSDIRASDE